MQTIKIKYYTENKVDSEYIDTYCTQYASMLHCSFNLYKKGLKQKEIEKKLSLLNNTSLVNNSFDMRSCAMHSNAIFKSNKTQIDEDGNINKLIFGGRKSFLDLIKGNITKHEWKDKRKIYYSIGESNQKGNRRFQLNKDLKSITFKPNKDLHVELKFNGKYKNYKNILEKLYKAQEAKFIPITYTLSKEYINISFDEKLLSENINPYFIKDRIFAIDLNPNYIGYSIVDWKSSSEFNVIKSGTISIKSINDNDFKLDKQHNVPSTDKRRIKINNKRNHEIFEISKFLTKECKHYQCEFFSMEDLNIKSSDKKKGSKFNKLCNNNWNRKSLVDNITKLCNILGIRVREVVPNYSSFVGNFLYRELNRPDMELASIEIGRRCFEFNHQYILKDKEQRKNIVTPDVNDFADRYEKSLEEFGVDGEYMNIVELYNFLKKSKCRYRLSLDSLNLKFSRCFSPKSLVMKNLYCFTNIS